MALLPFVEDHNVCLASATSLVLTDSESFSLIPPSPDEARALAVDTLATCSDDGKEHFCSLVNNFVAEAYCTG